MRASVVVLGSREVSLRQVGMKAGAGAHKRRVHDLKRAVKAGDCRLPDDSRRALEAAMAVIPPGPEDRDPFTLRTYTHLMPSSEGRTRTAVDLLYGKSRAGALVAEGQPEA